MADSSTKLKKRTLTLAHRQALSAAKGGNIPIIDRVMRKVVKTKTCWLWTGYKNKDGYGLFSTFVMSKAQAGYPHRMLYIEHKGEIPEGLVLDHLCRVRHCVNPDHLEPVTVQENTIRGLEARKDEFDKKAEVAYAF